MNKALYDTVESKLVTLYGTSTPRIGILVNETYDVITSKTRSLYSFVYDLDEFEEGIVGASKWREVYGLIFDRLEVNEDNANRLYDFCFKDGVKSMRAYERLRGEFYPFLSEERAKRVAGRR